MIKAVLFDFNGTLILDDPIHNETWNKTAIELFDKEIDLPAVFKVGGISRQCQIAEQYLKMNGFDTSQETIDMFTNKKCQLYEETIIEIGMTDLLEGATDFLDYLKERKIPMVLVTMSVKQNVDFYFDTYHLENWFKRNETIYDNGNYQSKKQMYLDAASNLGLSLKDCLVVEDSTTPIKDVIANGCENVIAVYRDCNYQSTFIKERIKDFTEVDYSIFSNVSCETYD